MKYLDMIGFDVEQEPAFSQAVFKGDVPEAQRIFREVGPVVLQTFSSVCARYNVTHLMLAVISPSEEMPEHILEMYPPEERGAQLSAYATGNDAHLYQEYSVLTLAILSCNTAKFNRLLPKFSSQDVLNVQVSRSNNCNTFQQLSDDLTVQGLSLLKSLYTPQVLQQELGFITKSGLHFIIGLIQGSKDIRMLDAVIDLYADPKQLEAQIAQENKSILFGAVNSGKKEIFARVLQLWPQLKSHVHAKGLLKRLAASSDDPEFFAMVSSDYTKDQLHSELTDWDVCFVTTALAHDHLNVAELAFKALPTQLQAKVLGRNYCAQTLPFAALIRTLEVKENSRDALKVLQAALSFYPTHQHRLKALLATCSSRNYRFKPETNSVGETIEYDDVSHILELLAVQGEWSAFEYLIAHYAFPISMIKDAHLAARRMYQVSIDPNYQAGLNRLTKALYFRATRLKLSAEILLYCEYFSDHAAHIKWNEIADVQLHIQSNAPVTDATELVLGTMLDEREKAEVKSKALVDELKQSYLKYAHFKLAVKQQFIIKSFLDLTLFQLLTEIPLQAQSLILQAITDPTIYYSFEKLFVDYQVNDAIKIIGELLGHPEPMNATVSKFNATHDARHVVIEENDVVVTTRKGVLNLRVENPPDHHVSAADIRNFIVGLLRDQKEAVEKQLEENPTLDEEFGQKLTQLCSTRTTQTSTEVVPFTTLLKSRTYRPEHAEQYIELFVQAKLANRAELVRLKDSDPDVFKQKVDENSRKLIEIQADVSNYCDSFINLATCLEACRGEVSRNDRHLSYYERKALYRVALQRGNFQYIEELVPDYEEIFECLVKGGHLAKLKELLPIYGKHVSTNHTNFLLERVSDIEARAMMFEHLPLSVAKISSWIKSIMMQNNCVSDLGPNQDVLKMLRPLFFRIDFTEELPLPESRRLYAALMMTDDAEFKAMVLLRTHSKFDERSRLTRKYFKWLVEKKFLKAVVLMGKMFTPTILSLSDVESAKQKLNNAFTTDLDISIRGTFELTPAYALSRAQNTRAALPGPASASRSIGSASAAPRNS